MPKARVYELAKELGVDSKTVLSKLEAMGEFVKSASSTVEPPVARKLRNAFASSGQGNASDSKKPAIRPRSLSNRHLIPCQSRPLRQHRSRLPPQRRSRIMPLPSPMPRSRAIARRVQANPASMAIVLTATPRVRRVETAASPVADGRSGSSPPAWQRSAGRQQRQWREAAHPGTAPGQQSVQPQAGHAHPDSG